MRLSDEAAVSCVRRQDGLLVAAVYTTYRSYICLTTSLTYSALQANSVRYGERVAYQRMIPYLGFPSGHQWWYVSDQAQCQTIHRLYCCAAQGGSIKRLD